MKTLSTLIVLQLFIFIHVSYADNTGQINGTVTDSATGEPLIGANVYVDLNGTLFGTITNDEGYYVLKPLQPGVYDVKCSYMGFREMIYTGVKVSQQNITGLNIKLGMKGVMLEAPIVHEYSDLITMEPKVVFDVDVIADMPYRKAEDIASTSPGVYQADDGEELYFRGSRPEATEYYVDNMKIVGDYNVPAGAIAEIIVYSGGIPARYGDVTGGVVVITTKSYNMYRHRFQ